MESSGESRAGLTVTVDIGCVRTTLALATIEAAQAPVMSVLFEKRFSNNPEVTPDVHQRAISLEQRRYCMSKCGAKYFVFEQS